MRVIEWSYQLPERTKIFVHVQKEQAKKLEKFNKNIIKFQIFQRNQEIVLIKISGRQTQRARRAVEISIRKWKFINLLRFEGEFLFEAPDGLLGFFDGLVPLRNILLHRCYSLLTFSTLLFGRAHLFLQFSDLQVVDNFVRVCDSNWKRRFQLI